MPRARCDGRIAHWAAVYRRPTAGRPRRRPRAARPEVEIIGLAAGARIVADDGAGFHAKVRPEVRRSASADGIAARFRGRSFYQFLAVNHHSTGEALTLCAYVTADQAAFWSRHGPDRSWTIQPPHGSAGENSRLLRL